MHFVAKEFRRHKWRMALSISGYAVASVFFLMILSISRSGKDDSLGVLKNTGTHLILYIPTDADCCGSSIASGSVFAEGVKTMMLDSFLIQTVRNIDGIRDAAPYLLYRMFHENFHSDISIGGIDTSRLSTTTNVCARTNLISGKFFSDNPDEVIAEEAFATAHHLNTGDTLSAFGGKVVIGGIVNSGIKPVKADLYAPIQFVRTILREKLKCVAPDFDMNIILVEVEDARLQDDVIGKIKKMMYKFSISSYNCYEPAYKVMAMIEKSSIGLSAVIFIFLIIFSARTQLADTLERFRETGILKSLGWSDRKLSINIIILAFIQAVIGVLIGLLAGIAILFILKKYEFPVFQLMELNFKYTELPALFGFSIAGGLLACIFPIIKVCSTRAGEILKSNL